MEMSSQTDPSPSVTTNQSKKGNRWSKNKSSMTANDGSEMSMSSDQNTVLTRSEISTSSNSPTTTFDQSMIDSCGKRLSKMTDTIKQSRKELFLAVKNQHLPPPDSWSHSTREASYGEVTSYGMRKLFDCLDLKPTDQFLDLGSGFGNMVFYSSFVWGCNQSIGIETDESRHEFALEMTKHLEALACPHWNSEQVRFLHTPDLLKMMEIPNITELLKGITHVFINNILLDPFTIDELAEMIIKIAGTKVVFVLTNNPWPRRAIKKVSIKKLKSIQIEKSASWCNKPLEFHWFVPWTSDDARSTIPEILLKFKLDDPLLSKLEQAEIPFLERKPRSNTEMANEQTKKRTNRKADVEAQIDDDKVQSPTKNSEVAASTTTENQNNNNPEIPKTSNSTQPVNHPLSTMMTLKYKPLTREFWNSLSVEERYLMYTLAASNFNFKAACELSIRGGLKFNTTAPNTPTKKLQSPTKSNEKKAKEADVDTMDGILETNKSDTTSQPLRDDVSSNKNPKKRRLSQSEESAPKRTKST